VLFMVVGFGMLVVASMTGTVVWGWVSVAVSVLAAVILIFDWRRKWATISDRAPIDLTAYAPSSTADSRRSRCRRRYTAPSLMTVRPMMIDLTPTLDPAPTPMRRRSRPVRRRMPSWPSSMTRYW
jgi:hypothetical protein